MGEKKEEGKCKQKQINRRQVQLSAVGLYAGLVELLKRVNEAI